MTPRPTRPRRPRAPPSAAAQGVWRSVFFSAIIGWILLLSFLFAATNVSAIDDGAGYSTHLHLGARLRGRRSW